MHAIHSSSSAAGRASSAGNESTTPALHCAITRSGTEMINSGEPITGIDRRPLNRLGMDIERQSFIGGDLNAARHTNKAIFPLALYSNNFRQLFRPAEFAASLQEIGIDQPLEREHLVPLRRGQQFLLEHHDLVQRLAGSPDEISVHPRIGSLALRLCRVAHGELDAAFAGGQSKDWDLAAANLIVQEANGRMTALSGDAIVYNRRDVVHGVLVAAGRDRHARIVGHFRNHPLP
ncbi:hypothetical protein KXW38_009030 [Aspergillus fumigatus]|nr:hypothetical protein KXW38_009030 [Aspergillus fumigatus]